MQSSDERDRVDRVSSTARSVSFGRRHWLFVILFCAGAVLRYFVHIAYQPVLLLQRDTYTYLNHAVAENLAPTEGRPVLYPIAFVRPLLEVWRDLSIIPLVQHLLVLGLAIALYVLLQRLGAPSWVAALGTVPILLDGYQLNIEQYLLTETLFEVLLAGGIVVLAWRSPPPLYLVAASGVLLALASLTRFAGAAVIGVAFIYVLTRPPRWRRSLIAAATLLVAFVIPLGLYSFAYSRSHSTVGVTSRNGFFLYGRVAAFAQCEGVDVPAHLTRFCFEEPLGQRPRGGAYSVAKVREWDKEPGANAKLLDFSLLMIRTDPLGYLGAVLDDFSRFFENEPPLAKEQNVRHWLFVEKISDAGLHPLVEEHQGSAPAELGFESFRIDEGIARRLGDYQKHVYVTGPLLAILVTLGLAGGAFGRSIGDGPTRSVTLLLVGSGVTVLLFPMMITVWHYRLILPSLALVGSGAALGSAALWNRIRPFSPSEDEFADTSRRPAIAADEHTGS